MEYEEILNKIKPELEKTLDYLKQEMLEIRSSRPLASLVDSLEVDCFGKKFPLKSLAMITMSERREIIIQPWDPSYLEPIENAFFNSSLQLSPVREEGRLKISFPPMTEELRQKIVKLVAEKTEKTTQTVRHWRKEARKKIDDAFTEGELSEDNKFKAREKLDELISEYNEKIDEMSERKKKEVME